MKHKSLPLQLAIVMIRGGSGVTWQGKVFSGECNSFTWAAVSLCPIWQGFLTPSCPGGPPAALSCDKKRMHASSTLPGHAVAGKCTFLKHFLNNGKWHWGNVLRQFCSTQGAAAVKMEMARTQPAPPVKRIFFAWAANITTLFPCWCFFLLTHCFSFSCDECSHLWTLGRIVYGTIRPSVWTHTVMEIMLVVQYFQASFRLQC